ncbi:MAG TPA: inositol monophosphatase family protein, partial [Bacteroidales bacterium]|nr:inositol monophosphatase family protein [Bacteroidales bacterium]
MNYESICIKACEVVKHTADFILGEWNRLKQDNVEIKGIHNFVTYVDKQSEIQLVEQFQKILPNSVFITEEETNTTRGVEYNWIIDPIDGTTNFIHGVPPHAISIALMQNKGIVLGVVYEIMMDECFYSWLGA